LATPYCLIFGFLAMGLPIYVVIILGAILFLALEMGTVIVHLHVSLYYEYSLLWASANIISSLYRRSFKLP